MYTTNLPDACYHCLYTSKANIAVVEDDKQLEKILSVRSRLPHLKAIIQYEGKPTVNGVLSVSLTNTIIQFLIINIISIFLLLFLFAYIIFKQLLFYIYIYILLVGRCNENWIS